MKIERLTGSFFSFLLLFFSSVAMRFESEVYSSPGQPPKGSLVIVLILVSAVFFATTIRRIGRIRFFSALVVSVVFCFSAFFGISRIEKTSMEKSWIAHAEEKDFSVSQGHCAPNSGRAMSRILDRILKTEADRNYRNSRFDSLCRLRHFKFLEDLGALPCKDKEGQTKCTLRWATVFARSGNWDHASRSFFYKKVISSWQLDHDLETLVEYALMDRDFSILTGHEREKDANQALTWKLFAEVAEHLRKSESKSRPEPYHFRFKEAWSEVIHQGTPR